MSHRHLRISTLLLLGAAGCAPIGAGSPDPEPGSPEAPPTADAAAPPPSPAALAPSYEMNAPVVGVRASRVPISLAVSESVGLADLGLVAVDAQGNIVSDAVFSAAVPRGNAASLSPGGMLTGLREGETQLVVTALAPGVGGLTEARVFPISVLVRGGLVRFLQVAPQAYAVYQGTAVPFEVEARTARGELRERIDVVWASRNPEIASVSRTGLVRGLRAGSATIVASAEGLETAHVVQVLPNPVRSVELTPDNASVRTGDVVRFDAVPRNARGGAVRDITLTYAVGGEDPASDVGATVSADGSFVAERPGRYRVVANAGGVAADAVIEVRARDVARQVSTIGAFSAANGELRVFRGRDGRDYVYVGHSVAAGDSLASSIVHVWDVTMPEGPFIVDSVSVVGAELTDLEISADGSFAVVAQRSADGMGGIVVLGLADPAHPAVISAYPSDFPGGVRDIALSGSLAYAIGVETPEVAVFDLTNPVFPVEVGGWATERPGRYLNEIRVSDGLAYLAAGSDGVWILDVGDGRWGGAPSAPAIVASYAYPDGRAATTFPYRNADGHPYLFVGDDVAPGGTAPRGFVRVLSLDDPETPVEVARYEVPEAGIREFRVLNDELHAAYAQAGLRIVDVSGELRGDLYRQAREIAWLPTGHAAGGFPNASMGSAAPMAFAVHAHAGTIYVADEGSGIWAVRLAPRAVRTEAGGG